MLHDELSQSFYDGTLAHTRFTDEDGVVLLPAIQDLGYSLYFLLSSHDGVEQVFCSHLCQVCAEVVEGRCLAFLFLLLANGDDAAFQSC